MQFKPNKNTRHTLIIGGFLLTISICFLVFANMGWGYLWLNQLGAVGFLSLVIWLAVRYVLTDFVYCLPENEDILEVKRISGKLPVTVVRIDISADDVILPYSKEVKKQQKLDLIENCCVSLMPEESYLYICTLNGKKVGVRIECKADLVELLQNAIQKASVRVHEGGDE